MRILRKSLRLQKPIRQLVSVYTQMNLYINAFKSWEFGKEAAQNVCVWSERPLLNSKARVKTKNLLPS
jgi:hypothetical protein